MNSKLMTAKEVCEFFSINNATLWRWRKNGTIKEYRVEGRVYYKREEVESLAK